MRRKRLNTKRRRYKKILFLAQIIVIWYVTMFSITSLTSTTGAYYSSISKNESVIQAGTWWDGSFLKFIGVPTQNVKACAPTEIGVEVMNSGFSMIGSTKYEIYYTTKGNPKENGEPIAEKEFGPVSSGETILIRFNAEKDGTYMFRLYQRPGFEEKSQNMQYWSEKVHVNCNAANSNNEKVADEQKNDEGKEIEINNEGIENIPSEESQNQNINQNSVENVVEDTETNNNQEIEEEEKTNSQQNENINEEVTENKE